MQRPALPPRWLARSDQQIDARRRLIIGISGAEGARRIDGVGAVDAIARVTGVEDGGRLLPRQAARLILMISRRRAGRRMRVLV